MGTPALLKYVNSTTRSETISSEKPSHPEMVASFSSVKTSVNQPSST